LINEAEGQDNLMTSIYSTKDQYSQEFEDILKKSLGNYCKSLNPLFGKLKNLMISQICENVRNYHKILDDDTIKRLQMTLSYGGKDLSEEELERVLVSATSAELNSKANQALYSTVQIASDYLYEKMQDKLQDYLFEMNAAQEAEEAKKNAPVTSNTHATKPSPTPTKNPSGSTITQNQPKPQPKVPPKSTKKPSTSKGGKPGKEDETEAHIESLPKVESTLTHANKDKVALAQPKKRPPTRKPRPAPPSTTSM